MSKMIRLIGSMLIVVCLSTLSLPAITRAQSRAAATSDQSLTTKDWPDATYTTSCLAARPRRFVVHHGIATDSSVHFQVYSPIYADLTGDGQPEAIVPYSCTGADFGGVHAFVYSGTASAPRLLGDLPSPTPANSGQTFSSILTVTVPSLAILPAARVLQIDGSGYSANAIHTCPDLHMTARYRVTSGRLALISFTARRASGCLSL